MQFPDFEENVKRSRLLLYETWRLFLQKRMCRDFDLWVPLKSQISSKPKSCPPKANPELQTNRPKQWLNSVFQQDNNDTLFIFAIKPGFRFVQEKLYFLLVAPHTIPSGRGGTHKEVKTERGHLCEGVKKTSKSSGGWKIREILPREGSPFFATTSKGERANGRFVCKVDIWAC